MAKTGKKVLDFCDYFFTVLYAVKLAFHVENCQHDDQLRRVYQLAALQRWLLCCVNRYVSIICRQQPSSGGHQPAGAKGVYVYSALVCNFLRKTPQVAGPMLIPRPIAVCCCTYSLDLKITYPRKRLVSHFAIYA